MSAKKYENAVNDEKLEDVSGGYIFLNDQVIYEVIDNNGDVVATARNFYDAEAIAKDKGLSTRFIVWDELNDIRKKHGK